MYLNTGILLKAITLINFCFHDLHSWFSDLLPLIKSGSKCQRPSRLETAVFKWRRFVPSITKYLMQTYQALSWSGTRCKLNVKWLDCKSKSVYYNITTEYFKWRWFIFSLACIIILLYFYFRIDEPKVTRQPTYVKRVRHFRYMYLNCLIWNILVLMHHNVCCIEKLDHKSILILCNQNQWKCQELCINRLYMCRTNT